MRTQGWRLGVGCASTRRAWLAGCLTVGWAFALLMFQGCSSGGMSGSASPPKDAARRSGSPAPDTTSFVPEPPGASGLSEPLALTIGVNEGYCRKTACKCVHHIAAREFEPLQQRLKDRFGIQLDLSYFPGDLFELQKRIQTGELDGALAKPWPILKCAREAKRNYLRVADLLNPNGNAELRGIVLVKRDSPIHTWADLAGKRVAWGQADAYEKHHAVLALFRRQGVDPASLKMQELSSCMENIGALLDDTADVAAISDYAFDVDCLVDFAKKEDFRVLGQTEPAIPAASLLLDMDRVAPAKASRLVHALLSLAGDPDLKDALLGDGFVKPAPWSPAELPELAR